MRSLRYVLPAMVAVAVFLAAGAPAVASNGPSSWATAPAAACASGTVDTYGMTTPTKARISGLITPCQPVSGNTAFGFMISTAANTSTEFVLLPYSSAGTTSFSLDVDSSLFSYIRAVCLAYSPAHRLSCFATYGPHGPGLYPIPLDDPLVTLPYVPNPDVLISYSPACGACV